MNEILIIDFVLKLIYLISGFFFGMAFNELKNPKIITQYIYLKDNGVQTSTINNPKKR